MHDMSRTQAMLMRVMNSIQGIQRLWRSVSAIRREQRSVLLAQLLRAEGRLLRTNMRRCSSSRFCHSELSAIQCATTEAYCVR